MFSGSSVECSRCSCFSERVAIAFAYPLPSACTEEHNILQTVLTRLHSEGKRQWICESHWHTCEHTSHTNNSSLWLLPADSQGRWESSCHGTPNSLPLWESIQLSWRVETDSPHLICIPDLQGNGEWAKMAHPILHGPPLLWLGLCKINVVWSFWTHFKHSPVDSGYKVSSTALH